MKKSVKAMFALLFIFVAGTLHGQEKAKEGIDLNAAVTKLKALGWKSVRGAEWGKFESRQHPNDGGLSPYGYGNSISLSGNAWLREDEGTKRVVYGGGFQEYFPSSTPKKKKGLLSRMLGGGGGGEEFKWSEQELDGDLEALHQWLQGGKESDEYSWQYSRKTTEALALALAVQLYESGREEQGQKLADAVMASSINGEALVDELVSGLARRRLGELTKEFCSNNESRESYLRDLKKLQKDFPRGWVEVIGVQRLVNLLEKTQPNSVGVAVPEGVTLEKEVVAHLEEWAGPGEGLQGEPTGQWIWGGKMRGAKDSPFAAVCEEGMAGFLGLAVAVTDETVTRRLLQGASGAAAQIARMTRSFSSDGPNENEIWQNMVRPATRGEFAKKLLIPVLPGDSSEYEEMDGEGLQGEAMAFWKKHQSSTPAQIASAYLSEGSAEQVTAAVTFLVESGEKESLSIFEKQVLAQPDISQWYEAVKVYLRKGRGETAGFWGQLRPQWEQQLENVDQGELYQLGISARSGKTLLNLLDRYSGGESIVKMLRSLSKKEDIKEIGQEFQTYLETLQELDEEKRSGVLLEAIEPSDSSAYLMMVLYYVSYFQPDLDSLMKKGKPFWEQMLAKTEPLPPEISRGQIPNLAGLAAFVLENAAEGEPELVREKSEVMGEEFYPFCLTRAEARFAEEEIPPWPDAGNVDSAQRKKMLAELEAASLAEKAEVLAKWNHDQKMAWAEMREEWSQEEGPPAWVVALGPVLLESKLSDEERTLLNGLQAGEKVSAPWLKELVTSWPLDAPELDGRALNIMPSTDKLGLRAQLAGVDSQEGQWLARYLEVFEESIGESPFIHAVWLSAGETNETIFVEGTVPEDDEEWEAILTKLKTFVAHAEGTLADDVEPVTQVSLFVVRHTKETLAALRAKTEEDE